VLVVYLLGPLVGLRAEEVPVTRVEIDSLLAGVLAEGLGGVALGIKCDREKRDLVAVPLLGGGLLSATEPEIQPRPTR